MEALLIMLCILSFPNRWCDFIPLFGRGEPELSTIFSLVGCIIFLSIVTVINFLPVQIIDDVYERFKHFLTALDLIWLNPDAFSAAVHAKGAALQNCWWFIDGTVRPIARPTQNQNIM